MFVSQSGYYGILICLRSFRIFGLTGRVFFSPIVEGIEFNSSKVHKQERKKERKTWVHFSTAWISGS
jgi:hypothetical protein